MANTHCTHGKNNKYAYNLAGKPQGKKSLGRPRLKWENNIEIYVRNWTVNV